MVDLFVVAVAFWNLVGAGLSGFMINPPVALYYMQGLTTPFTAMPHCLVRTGCSAWDGCSLPCARFSPVGYGRKAPIRFAFWAINIGLMAMALLSLLPVGLMQTWASVEHGYW